MAEISHKEVKKDEKNRTQRALQNDVSELFGYRHRKAASEMLGVSRHLAYKLIDNGELQAVKIGTSLKIPKISVINYVLGEEVKQIG